MQSPARMGHSTAQTNMRSESWCGLNSILFAIYSEWTARCNYDLAVQRTVTSHACGDANGYEQVVKNAEKVSASSAQ